MKKIVTCVLAIILIFSISCTVVNASDTSTETIRINNTSNVQNNNSINNSINNSNQTTNTIKAESTEQIIQIKDKEEKKLEDYVKDYGSETYGLAAYILNKVRLYSIPFGVVGIVFAAIYQYVIGIRKLDVRDKGFNIMIAIITVLVICQILPLIFAIIVKGWRG